MKKVLLMCHRASPVLERLVGYARERDLFPVAISSATNDDGSEWFETCARLGVPASMAASHTIGIEEVEALMAREPGEYVFAFSSWDGQRALMAQINERLGANDSARATIVAVQDKLLFRQRLIDNGLSRLRVIPAGSPEAYALAGEGVSLIVKPRRGLGSLMTARVSSAAELDHMNRLFDEGIPEEDLFSEFTRANELIGETFFDGTEFSFEVVRSHGRTQFWCIHEKTPVQFSESTVLEPGFTSPCISIGEQDVAAGLAIVEQALALFELHAGCFHVEVRRNARGEWEFIEINTRMGGAMIGDSVHAQYGRHLMADWMDVLLDRDIAPLTPPTCGTYVQCGFAFGDKTLVRISASPVMRTPDIVKTPGKVGMTASNKREDIATLCLWKTERDRHAEQVAALAVDDYFTLEYAD